MHHRIQILFNKIKQRLQSEIIEFKSGECLITYKLILIYCININISRNNI